MAIFNYYCRKFELNIRSISTSTDTSFVKDRFEHHSGPITSNDLFLLYREREPNITRSTINWRIYELVNTHVLKRIGRGLFLLGKEVVYHYNFSDKLKNINTFIQKNLPYINYCLWDSSVVNEFAQHISGHHFVLVDVERDAAESVYHLLKDQYKPVFFRLNERLFSELIMDFDQPLIVRFLVSESPVDNSNDGPSPMLEKLLVDFFCDQEFSFLQGGELFAVYRNAFSKYTINQTKLLRYAARKGKKEEIKQYLTKL